MPTATLLTRSPLCFLVALALLPSGCFDPMVTEDVGGPASETDDTTAGSAESGTAEGTTAVEPDSGSGDPPAVCGDGVVEGPEVCDDGVNDGGYGGCSADCSAPGPWCGDGIVNGEEPCDDGDDVDGNGCNVDCVVSGSVLWTVTYDGADHETDVASSVAVDSEDNVVVVGRSTVDGEGWIWVAKYTADGAEVWNTTLTAASGESNAYDVAILPNDDIIVVGTSNDGFGSSDAWIRRYSADGDTVWTRTHGGVADELDSSYAVVTDAAGNIYVAIDEGQVGIGNGIVSMVRKYTEDGEELWTIFQPAGVRLDDLALLPSGSLIIAGRVGENQFWTPMLQEMNSDGGIQWEEVFDEQAPGWYSAIDVNASGEIGLILALQGENNSRIMRLGSDRQEIWSELPWGFNSITEGVLIDDLGWLSCTGGAGQDSTFWTRKYQPDGVTAWTDTYNGREALLGSDQGEGIARDSLGNLISVGYVTDTEESATDAWVRKFAP